MTTCFTAMVGSPVRRCIPWRWLSRAGGSVQNVEGERWQIKPKVIFSAPEMSQNFPTWMVRFIEHCNVPL